jgi:hypothetical protein
MESLVSGHMRIDEEQVRTDATSRVSDDESKMEEHKSEHPSAKYTRASRYIGDDTESCNNYRSISVKPVQFRPLYEKLDSKYYAEEALLMRMPGQDGRRE